MFGRRVTIFVGHFGSGKTEIALNGALDLREGGERVTLADLDVVKPYFRSRSARALLERAGVSLIAPEGEHIHADLPIIVPQIRSILREPGRRVIMDVGGDGSGARVLGSLLDVIPVAETNCYVVLNFRRPSTPDVASAVAMVREIEAVSRARITGLVSNTHLMDETTAEVVLEGHRSCTEVGRILDLPMVAVTVQDRVRESLNGHQFDCLVMVLRRIVLPPHEQKIAQRTTGPLFVLN